MENTLMSAYNGDKPYIFVSFSHRDLEETLEFVRQLKEDGFRVWYDEGVDPGTEWDENIAAHVEGCEFFLALLSENYLESSNCRDELNYARDLGKTRVLVYLEDVELPGGMKMRLSRLQAVRKYSYANEGSFLRKLYKTPGIEICRADEAAPEEKNETVPEEENGLETAAESEAEDEPRQEDETEPEAASETEDEPEDAARYIFCPHCGRKLPASSAFCRSCGARIKSRGQAGFEAAEDDENAGEGSGRRDEGEDAGEINDNEDHGKDTDDDGGDAGGKGGGKPESPKKSGRKGLIIAVIAAAVVVAAVVVAVVVILASTGAFTGKSASSDSAQAASGAAEETSEDAENDAEEASEEAAEEASSETEQEVYQTYVVDSNGGETLFSTETFTNGICTEVCNDEYAFYNAVNSSFDYTKYIETKQYNSKGELQEYGVDYIRDEDEVSIVLECEYEYDLSENPVLSYITYNYEGSGKNIETNFDITITYGEDDLLSSVYAEITEMGEWYFQFVKSTENCVMTVEYSSDETVETIEVLYEYDSDGKLTRISCDGGFSSNALGYTVIVLLFGGPASDYYNGYLENLLKEGGYVSYQYDDRGNCTSQYLELEGGSSAITYEYIYGDDGELLQRIGTPEGRNYSIVTKYVY